MLDLITEHGAPACATALYDACHDRIHALETEEDRHQATLLQNECLHLKNHLEPFVEG